MSNVLESKDGEELGIFLRRCITSKRRGWLEKSGKRVYVIIDAKGRYEYTTEQIQSYCDLVRKAEEVNLNSLAAIGTTKNLVEYLKDIFGSIR